MRKNVSFLLIPKSQKVWKQSEAIKPNSFKADIYVGCFYHGNIKTWLRNRAMLLWAFPSICNAILEKIQCTSHNALLPIINFLQVVIWGDSDETYLKSMSSVNYDMFQNNHNLMYITSCAKYPTDTVSSLVPSTTVVQSCENGV